MQQSVDVGFLQSLANHLVCIAAYSSQKQTFLIELSDSKNMSQEHSSAWWPSPRDGQARITLFGSHHFHTPGNDEQTMELDDPLSPKRQRELVVLREHIQERSFDHIAVECPADRQSGLNKQYQAIQTGTAFDDEDSYPDGPIPLRSETVQVGFRVADALDLDSIHAVDSRPDPPDMDASWAIEEDPAEVPYPQLDAEELVRAEQEMIRNSTYLESLREQNRMKSLRQNQTVNIAASLTSSDGDEYTGSTQIGYWYERNARILENLSRITDPDEETLFVVGASHVIPVKQLAQAAPATCPRSALPLLTQETNN
jgi:hypothetical protein